MRLLPEPLPRRVWCGCLAPIPVRAALGDIVEELGEFLREPSADELSDVAFGIGRLLGACSARAYVPMWGQRRHVTKIVERMDAHGCVRSTRHLVDGRCPDDSV